MLYNLASLVARYKVPLVVIAIAIPTLVLAFTRCSIALPSNPFAGPESALDGVVNAIQDRKPERICDYVFGTCISINIDELEKQFPSTKKIFQNVRITFPAKQYDKTFDNGEEAKIRMKAYVKIEGAGAVGQQRLDFEAMIVKDFDGRWRIKKESLQSFWDSLTKLY